MAQEIRTFSVTIPAGTLSSNPAKTNVNFPTRIVEQIDAVFPQGPSGLVGIAIAAGGQAVIPYGASQWIIADNETVYMPVADQVQSGAWSVIGYNTGSFAHTVQVRFYLNLPPVPQAALASPASIGAISGSI